MTGTARSCPPWDVLPRAYLEKLTYRLRDRLPVWTLYIPCTRDYPGRWIARLLVSLPEPRISRVFITRSSLEELREGIPRGLFQLARHPTDSLVIEEVWF